MIFKPNTIFMKATFFAISATLLSVYCMGQSTGKGSLYANAGLRASKHGPPGAVLGLSYNTGQNTTVYANFFSSGETVEGVQTSSKGFDAIIGYAPLNFSQYFFAKAVAGATVSAENAEGFGGTAAKIGGLAGIAADMRYNKWGLTVLFTQRFFTSGKYGSKRWGVTPIISYQIK